MSRPAIAAFQRVSQRIAIRPVGLAGVPRFLQSAAPNASVNTPTRSSSRKLMYATLGAASVAIAAGFSTIAADAAPALTKEMDWTPFKVKEVEHISPNTAIIRFDLPEGKKRLGLTVASLVMVRVPNGEKDGKPDFAIRPYTPVSPEGLGHFDLMIKKYPTGIASSFIHALKPGQTLEFKGPIMKFQYKPNDWPEILMLAGGSGITPMIQVTREIVENPTDMTKVTILFANQTEDDILCRELLESWQAKHPEKLKVFYTLEKPPANWKQGKGFVTEEMLSPFLPRHGAGNKIFVCGPPAMMKHLSGDKAPDKSQGELSGLLKDLGYTEAEVYKF